MNEVVLGVEFFPLPNWNLSHFGRLFDEIRGDFPGFDTQPPLPSQIELLDDAFVPSVQTVQIMMGTLDARCWYKSADGNRLIQVQRDRFITNWRKVREGDIYPRYETEIRPFFQREWERFTRFLVAHDLAAPQVRQAEVTYVNDIQQGEGWQSVGDLGRVIAPWSGERTDGFLPDPETVQANITYRMEGNRGRLHVALQHLRRVTDAREVLQLRLTARGAPSGSTPAELLEWLDLGRRWVVHGFSDFTARRAQQEVWGRQQ